MNKLKDWFRHLSLQRKLTVIFLCTILMAAALNVCLYTQSGQIAASVSTIYESNISLSELRETLVNIQQTLYDYLSGDYGSLSTYYTLRKKLTDACAGLNDRVNDSLPLRTEKNIRGLLDSYVLYADSAVAGYRGTDVAQYGVDYEKTLQVYNYIQAFLHRLNEERFAENTHSYQLLLEMQRYSQTMNLLIVALMTMAELLALILLTRQSMQPLEALSQRAAAIGQGELNLPGLPVVSSDEIGQMTIALNNMTVQLNAYIKHQQEALINENRLKEEQLRLEGLLKDAQLGALQAQINPHFLYNTLNAGSQLAMMEGAERTCQFVGRVADFFRYNLRRSNQPVTLREEMEQAENYLFIMNTRYSGEILCERSMPEVLPQVHLPGMVLQPIVENAINHGLHDIEGEKRLVFAVIQEPERIIVSVRDNGPGIAPDVAASILCASRQEMPERAGQHGVGLANVISRLRLYLGREDVMEIRSGEGVGGTEVRILIPKEAEEDVPNHFGG